MRRKHTLGLDELMIVNPGRPGARAFMLLGDDGALYRVGGLGRGDELQGQLFLGEDGALYQVQGFGLNGPAGSGRFFLGEDGSLYQVVR